MSSFTSPKSVLGYRNQWMGRSGHLKTGIHKHPCIAYTGESQHKVLRSGHGFQSHLSKNVFLLLRFHSSELLGTPRHLIQTDLPRKTESITCWIHLCSYSSLQKWESSFLLTRNNINAVATSIPREEYCSFFPKSTRPVCELGLPASRVPAECPKLHRSCLASENHLI